MITYSDQEIFVKKAVLANIKTLQGTQLEGVRKTTRTLSALAEIRIMSTN
jgi:hypothetical protein